MTLQNYVASELLRVRFPEKYNDDSWLNTNEGSESFNVSKQDALVALEAVQTAMPCWARITCWKCGEEVEPTSSEKYIYRNIIRKMENMMCDYSKENGYNCDSYNHEDCRVLEILVEEYRSLLEKIRQPEDEVSYDLNSLKRIKE